MTERIEVELHSTDPSAVDAVRRTLDSLGGGRHELVEEAGRFYIATDNPGFIRFAVVRQGYVKRIVESAGEEK